MLELISSQHLTALFQVIMIDLVLAGDNAIVIGMVIFTLRPHPDPIKEVQTAPVVSMPSSARMSSVR